MQPKFDKARLPMLGVGLSFRTEIAQEIVEQIDSFDFLELIVETAFAGILPDDFYEQVVGRVPVTAHGVSASLGSLDEARIDDGHLERVKAELARLRCPWFSEHLAFTKAQQVDAGQLLPLQRSQATVDFVAQKIRHMAEAVGIPVLIENIAYYFNIPGAEMDEAEFLTRVIEAADCGLLLDINNLYANCLNHGLDPMAFIDSLPADRVVEIHLAGGEEIEDVYIDTHGHAVNQAVFDLFAYACRTKAPKAVVLEREKNIPSIDELIEEIQAIKSVWQQSRMAITA
ncbi:DUF692 domain-containing protein [Thalassomonas actiniarum]|uniref:DUF692 domain-containing protein n=1 Tax=Thalassomonas actiniarum TaxID=485447 RepID=A0AAF0C665_9GAMM|nr:DUF692 domain-containing protein [Thalassomonas actiniarum]WDE02278.1 DUF692 domain-containing protein [Thalassomonas actiniarum]